jgi:hypothetical protein
VPEVLENVTLQVRMCHMDRYHVRHRNHFNYGGTASVLGGNYVQASPSRESHVAGRGRKVGGWVMRQMDYFMWIEQEALRGLQKRNELSAPYICLPLFSFLLLPLHPSLFWCFV